MKALGFLILIIFFSCNNSSEDKADSGEGIVVKEGLLAYYIFSSNAKNQVSDSVDGVINGKAQFTTDKKGNKNSAISFDGVNDYVLAGKQSDFKFDSTFTVTMWINHAGAGSGNSRYGDILFNKEGRYEFAVDSTGNINFAIANTSPGWRWVTTNKKITRNTWQHLSIQYDRGLLKILIDTKEVLSYKGLGNIEDADKTHDEFRIGDRERFPGSQAFRGKMDNVRIYNRSISQSELNEVYNSEK